ncbi:MAG TPA: hypothetical protein VE868_08530 [Balneolaceae bacterium]|nr:hypothetical protein [Balneolaceae bacterium]
MNEKEEHTPGDTGPSNDNGSGEPEKEHPPTREYRLIPADSEEKTQNDSAVNFRELYDTAYNNRQTIYKITGVLVLIGLLFALLSGVEYRSKSILMPVSKNSGQSQASTLMQQYGGLLGLSSAGATSVSQEGKIKPSVYPKIIQSLSFQDKLLRQPLYIPGADTTISGYTYFEHYYSPFFKVIRDYTIGLPGKIRGGHAKNRNQLPANIRKEFNDSTSRLTRKRLRIINNMRSRISFDIDSETGLLHISAQMPNPVIAGQICKDVIQQLKNYVIAYSTQKAKQNLKYAKMQHRQVKQRYEEAQNKFAKFQDQNVNLSSAQAQAKQQRLQAKVTLTSNLYNSVSQQLMRDRMQVEEQTPAFKVLQSPNIPFQKSEPRRLLILIISFIGGLVISFLYIGGKIIYEHWDPIL